MTRLSYRPLRQDRLDLAGEEQHLALAVRRGHAGDVERLDAEVVAGQGEPLLLAVPDGQAEHPVEPVERVGAPLRERLQHHLGVGVGGEGAAERDELLAQVEVVVDLAVVRDRVATVGGVHRLLAVRDVDDRQPPVGQAARAARDDALTVRAAVLLAVVHPLQQRVVGVESVVAGDAAHTLRWVLVLGGGAHGIRADAEAPACHGCPVRPIRAPDHGSDPVDNFPARSGKVHLRTPSEVVRR